MGEDFNVNGTGFTTETGQYESAGDLYYNKRPDKIFSEIGFGGGGNYTERIGGEVTDSRIHIDANATLKNQTTFRATGSYNGKQFDPYEGPDGHSYDSYIDFFINGGTNPFNPFKIWVGVGGGGYSFSGRYTDLMAKARLRPSAAFDLGLEGQYFVTEESENYNWDIGSYDKRATDWKSLTARANYIFTPDLNLRLFSQYSRFGMDFESTGRSESGEFMINVLFCWQYLPGSTLYVLAESLYSADEDGNFSKPDIGFYAKISWYLPI